MSALTLQDVFAATRADPPLSPPSAVLSGVSTDSRTLTPGQLFVALRGPSFDGHDFLSQAASRGAVGAVIRHDYGVPAALPRSFILIRVADPLLSLGRLGHYHRSKFALPVVAVTGSVGKTTTKSMIDHALSIRLSVLSSPDSWNNEIGVPLTLLQLRPQHEVAVLEMAMRGSGEIRYLAECAQPTVGVITNIGESHLERLGTVAAIAEAKAELLDGLPDDGIAVLNRNDPWHDHLAAHARGRKVTFGTTTDADYQAGPVHPSDAGLRFNVRRGGESCEVTLGLPGLHNAINAVAAIAVTGVLGLPLEDAAGALMSFRAERHRSHLLHLPGNITVLDDCYNASPTSVRAALQALEALPNAGRKLFVFGDMKELGPTARQAHQAVGARAVEAGIHVLITVGVEAQSAAREAERRSPGSMQTIYCDTPAQALGSLQECLQPGDCVLIKASRAMHLEEVVEGLQQSSLP